jgi:hypothetical protein
MVGAVMGAPLSIGSDGKNGRAVSYCSRAFPFVTRASVRYRTKTAFSNLF